MKLASQSKHGRSRKNSPSISDSGVRPESAVSSHNSIVNSTVFAIFLKAITWSLIIFHEELKFCFAKGACVAGS